MNSVLDDEQHLMDEREQADPTLAEAVHLHEPIGSLDLQPLTLVDPKTPLKQAFQLMIENNVGCLLVAKQGGPLLGIMTERDVLRRVCEEMPDTSTVTVDKFMTKRPATLRLGDPVEFALNRMYERGVRHVALVDQAKKPVGFVSIRDIVNHVVYVYRQEVLNLPPRPVRRMRHREGG